MAVTVLMVAMIRRMRVVMIVVVLMHVIVTATANAAHCSGYL
jgi:hypothetical protein